MSDLYTLNGNHSIHLSRISLMNDQYLLRENMEYPGTYTIVLTSSLLFAHVRQRTGRRIEKSSNIWFIRLCCFSSGLHHVPWIHRITDFNQPYNSSTGKSQQHPHTNTSISLTHTQLCLRLIYTIHLRTVLFVEAIIIGAFERRLSEHEISTENLPYAKKQLIRSSPKITPPRFDWLAQHTYNLQR